MRLGSSIKDLEKILNKKSEGFGKNLDEIGSVFLTVVTAANMLLNPENAINTLATGASISAIKPSQIIKFIIEKFDYKFRGKDITTKDRYERLSATNLILIHVAAGKAFSDKVMSPLQKYLIKVVIDKKLKDEIHKFSLDADKEISRHKLNLPMLKDRTSAIEYLNRLFIPITEILQEKIRIDGDEPLTITDLISNAIDETLMIYDTLILTVANEFPEFYLWIDINQKNEIISMLNRINMVSMSREEYVKIVEDNISSMETLLIDKFKESCNFIKFEEIIKRQNEFIEDLLNNDTRRKMARHHNSLKSYLQKSLQEQESIDGIKYPSNNDMFIPQSFKTIKYSRQQHERKILLTKFWDSIQTSEDIFQKLTLELFNPHNSFRPILILGNPGAGKSMFSNIFAARLCESSEFIPFLVKLRDVNSSNGEVSDHIKQGIEKSIESSTSIEWIDWLEQFPNRIPVIILDGYDELLQTSEADLYAYLLRIQELQEKIYDNSGISVRIVVTSRLAIMQEVTVPDETIILKLNSFDKKRQEQWINIWNTTQDKPGYDNFIIPDDVHIQELAKEPLLLFLLAMYDFEDSDLQKAVSEENFNQSKLYDRLFEKFAYRQLKKESNFLDLPAKKQKFNLEYFRLRIGLIGLMMFLNDKTNHDCDALKEELKQFNLIQPNEKSEEVFSGFFFIHENRSSDEFKEKTSNIEFLHKTFGEFLAADFLLRVASLRDSESEDYRLHKLAEDGVFKFCFGYNWLSKHVNIVNFLFEHSKNILKSESCFNIEKNIKKDLKDIFTNSTLHFTIKPIQLLEPKSRDCITHLAIYTQNMIILWNVVCAVRGMEELIFKLPAANYSCFDSAEVNKDNSAKRFDLRISQDIPDINYNVVIWKQLAHLWGLVGNKGSIARLGQWLEVNIIDGNLSLKQVKKEIINYFAEAARISNSDYEKLISYYIIDFSLDDVIKIMFEKPEYIIISLDLIYYRFEHIIENQLDSMRLFISEYLLGPNDSYGLKEITSWHKIFLKIYENRIMLGIPLNADLFRKYDLDALMTRNKIIRSEMITIIKVFYHFETGINRGYSNRELYLRLIYTLIGNSSTEEIQEVLNDLELTRIVLLVLARYRRFTNYIDKMIDEIFKSKSLANYKRMQYIEMIISGSIFDECKIGVIQKVNRYLGRFIIPDKVRLFELACIYSVDRNVVYEIKRKLFIDLFKPNNKANKPYFNIRTRLKFIELVDLYIDNNEMIPSCLEITLKDLERQRHVAPGEVISLRKLLKKYNLDLLDNLEIDTLIVNE